jgi:hypothetical protein
MAGTALFIGAGDMALRMAAGLLTQGRLDRLILTDVAPQRMADQVAMLDASHDARVVLRPLDGCDHRAVAALLDEVRPDLLVQAASLIGPWSIIGSDHPVVGHLSRAGIGIQLPNQLPVLMTVMRAVRDLGLSCPVANISAPDVTHPVLAGLDLAPTVGLGNVSMQLLRARSAWRDRRLNAGEMPGPVPLLRLIGHHANVYGVMQAKAPADPDLATRVFVGEGAERDDALAYEGHGFRPGPIYNVITAAASLPVLSALLPDGEPVRFSAPAPFGLPGGYPLTIAPDGVAFDLPAGIGRDEAVAINERLAVQDGIAAIGRDSIVHFTEAARGHAEKVDPRLAEPLDPRDLSLRTRLLLEAVAGAR